MDAFRLPGSQVWRPRQCRSIMGWPRQTGNAERFLLRSHTTSTARTANRLQAPVIAVMEGSDAMQFTRSYDWMARGSREAMVTCPPPPSPWHPHSTGRKVCGHAPCTKTIKGTRRRQSHGSPSACKHAIPMERAVWNGASVNSSLPANRRDSSTCGPGRAITWRASYVISASPVHLRVENTGFRTHVSLLRGGHAVQLPWALLPGGRCFWLGGACRVAIPGGREHHTFVTQSSQAHDNIAITPHRVSPNFKPCTTGLALELLW